MWKIHPEGRKMLVLALVFFLAVGVGIYLLAPKLVLAFSALAVFLLGFIGYFFRNPSRDVLLTNNNVILAPADGRVVVIEEAEEKEYFKDKRLQVSIFMSPTNVHVNRSPIGGIVNYFRYHEGKYLVAWHPKSSEQNERTTLVIDNGSSEILLRQIAGAMAKRIVSYFDEGQRVEQGVDIGFIKFGSRVDLFLPLSAKLDIEIGDKVKGNVTVIGRL